MHIINNKSANYIITLTIRDSNYSSKINTLFVIQSLCISQK